MTQNDTENAEIIPDPAQETEADGAPWTWTEPKEEAALHVAQDRLTDEKIAVAVGISRKTLARWKLEKDFAARVAEHVTEARDRVRRRGISVAENRVKRRQRTWLALQQIIDERGKDTEHAAVPGYKTGLLMYRRRAVGTGENTEFFDEYTLDVALLGQLDKLEEAAARDLGQRDKAPTDAPPPTPAKIAVEYQKAKSTDADSEE